MSPSNNLLVVMLAALLLGSVISHAPGHKRRHSPVPSIIEVPAPSPAESPVPTPQVEPALSPVEPPPSSVISPSMPPAEAPAPANSAVFKSVSIGLLIFGAFLVALIA